MSDVTDVAKDVRAGSLFVAVRGSRVDGRRLIASAIEAGACAVVAHGVRPDSLAVPVIEVEDEREALAHLCSAWHRHPSRDLRVVGVTGTNGKTTTTWLVDQVLRGGGVSTGLLGTIRYDTGATRRDSSMTTPNAPLLQRCLAEMRDTGRRAAVMEVSSHALDQSRVAAVEFDVAVVTNVSQDHLDYHGDLDSYAAAKARLLERVKPGGFVVLNADDARHRFFLDRVPAHAHVLRWSLDGRPDAEFRVSSRRAGTGTHVLIEGPWGRHTLRSDLLGDHNVANLAAACASAWGMGLDADTIVAAVAGAKAPPGRLEEVPAPGDVRVYVDYAHTPDALEVVLEQLRSRADGRLICVFGCGGDRDRTKRSVMGGVAERLADRVVITSDNPRTESPLGIVREILSGMDRPDACRVVLDRRLAIHGALEEARPGDTILLAGKGHETHQQVGAVRFELDERAEVRAWAARKGGAA